MFTRVLSCYGNVGCSSDSTELRAALRAEIEAEIRHKLKAETMAELRAELDIPRKSSGDPEPASFTGPGREHGDGTERGLRWNSGLPKPDAPITSLSIAMEEDLSRPSSEVFS